MNRIFAVLRSKPMYREIVANLIAGAVVIVFLVAIVIAASAFGIWS